MKEHQTTLKICVHLDKEELNVCVEDMSQEVPDFCSSTVTALIMMCTRMAERSFSALSEHYKFCKQGYECEVDLVFIEQNNSVLNVEAKSDGVISAFFRNGIARFLNQDPELLEMLGLD